MTINSTTRKTNPFVGNGSAHTFPFAFKVFTDADIVVKKLEASTSIETTLTLGLNNDYIVTLNADQNSNPGGSVTLKSGGNNQNLASGFSIVITSAVQSLQGTDLTNQGGFFPEVINDALDKSAILHQQQQTELDRSIRFSLTNTIGSLEITENANARKNRVLGFDNLGEFEVLQELGTYRGNWSASTAYAVRDLVKDTSTNNIFFCNTAHTSSGSQPLTTNTNSANWDLIVDAATATTSSTNAASSATAAANSATAAANSATAAATSETNAGNSATTASTKATQADTAKTAAQTAQTAAETAKTAAETALDSFDDRYLGAKANNPTVDNDGNALIDGALYFNTTVNRMRVYDLGNTTWLEVTISGSDLTNTNTVAGAITNVNNVGGSIANVNAVGGAIANVNTVATEINNNKLQTVANNINAVVTAADDLNEATSEIDTVANAITNVNNVGNSISNVNTVAGAISNVNAVAGNASNINTVGGAITNVNNVGGSIANVNTVASNLSGVNSFAERYRTDNTGNNPSTSLNAGDLFYNQASGKLLVYNGVTSAWEETQSVGNFFINTIGTFSGTGGNASSFDGTAYKFTLSNAGQFAQQMLVSINGVVQKPNTGTGQPSEGFALDGANIVFSSPPPSGADFFIVTIGASVSIGTPSDGTVTEAKLNVSNNPVNGYFLQAQSGAAGGLTWAQVSTDLVADTSPQLGGQLDTNGNHILLKDSDKLKVGTNGEFVIWNDTQNLIIDQEQDGLVTYIRAKQNGTIQFDASDTGNQVAAKLKWSNDSTPVSSAELYYGGVKKFETTSTGVAITGGLTTSGASTINADFTFAGASSKTITFDQSEGHIRYLDNAKAQFGTQGDLQIYHSGSQSYIKHNGTGNLYIDVAANEYFSVTSEESETIIQSQSNGAVELYYDNSKRFETTSAGATVSGRLITDSLNIVDDGSSSPLIHLSQDDSSPWAFVLSNQTYNNSSDYGLKHYVANDGNAVTQIRGNGAFKSYTLSSSDSSTSNDLLQLTSDRRVKLYYQGAGTCQTGSSGLEIINHRDIRFLGNGDWTGEGVPKIQHHSNRLYFVVGSSGFQMRDQSGYAIMDVTASGDFTGKTLTMDQDVHFNGGTGAVTLKAAADIRGTYGNWTGEASGSNGKIQFHSNHLYCQTVTNFIVRNSSGTNTFVVDSSGNYSSDLRKKENISTVDNALTKVSQLRGVEFKWKEKYGSKEDMGLIAQEVETVLPRLVSDSPDPEGAEPENEDGTPMKFLNYNGLFSVMIEAVKELKAKVETLETKVATLEGS